LSIGEFAKRAGVDRLFAIGAMSALAARSFGDSGRHFDSIQDLALAVTEAATPHSTVLVKGSRFMGMERVVEALGAADGKAGNGEKTAKGGA